MCVAVDACVDNDAYCVTAAACVVVLLLHEVVVVVAAFAAAACTVAEDHVQLRQTVAEIGSGSGGDDGRLVWRPIEAGSGSEQMVCVRFGNMQMLLLHMLSLLHVLLLLVYVSLLLLLLLHVMST